jgi:Ner family transcriptional regulator
LRRERERHERIKMRLRLAGSSLSQVARELGVQPTTVTSVCQGHRRSRRIEQLIASKLSTTPAELWPDRYGPSYERTSSMAPPCCAGGPSPRTDLY